MRITNFTDYSLRTLAFLNSYPERLCTTREIAEFYGISLNHIVKIVHQLSLEGYVQSVKGKGGGIRLKKKPEQINLKKLVLDFEPDFNLVECFNRTTNTCKIVRVCGLKRILRESLQAFLTVLDKYTLQDVFDEQMDILNATSISYKRVQSRKRGILVSSSASPVKPRALKS